MKRKNEKIDLKTAESPAPRKRFKIQKLEERIAPAKGGHGTHNCPTAGCGSVGTALCSPSTIF